MRVRESEREQLIPRFKQKQPTVVRRSINGPHTAKLLTNSHSNSSPLGAAFLWSPGVCQYFLTVKNALNDPLKTKSMSISTCLMHDCNNDVNYEVQENFMLEERFAF